MSKMKKCIFLLMCFWYIGVCVRGQEAVFSLDLNGDVMAESKYVESFGEANFQDITPYVLQKSYSLVLNSGESYTVKCSKFNGWENEPGDCHVIEIDHGGRSIFSFEYADGWEYIDSGIKNKISGNDFFAWYDLENDERALIFTGIHIMSQPPYLTVIVLKDGKATLVFNKPSYINKIEKNGDAIDFKLQSNTLEYLDSNTPINSPDLHTLTLKDGMIYYK